jgi:DNA-binding transcriptional LysR family regulator
VKPLTLQQFRGACAVVDCGFHVSRAANSLHTTQSAVSKTIKGLEDELGAGIFVRSAVRIVALTDYGHEFIDLARGILRDADTAVMRAQENSRLTRGVLRIGTTHVHARYSLPQVVQCFRRKYPEISVQLEQSDAEEVARWVSSRRVQIGISGSSAEAPHGVIALPAMKLDRCIVVPSGHALLNTKRPTLADVARYPIVAYSDTHPAGVKLRELFRKSGCNPNIAVTATDATVLKEYVAAGMGVAILHRIAIAPEDECRLAVIDASHLVPSTETLLIFRQGEYLRTYVYDFAEAFSPQWSRRSVMWAIAQQAATVGAAMTSYSH